MREKVKEILASEGVRYVVAGGMTTLVNYVIYLALEAVSVHYLVANSLAWCGAVVFAFFVNRQMVFHGTGAPFYEFVQFASARLLTLGLENILLAVLVQWIGLLPFFAKLFVSVVTVALNYIICKYGIFREKHRTQGGVSHE
ncbi:MAG: GtrA family protein [Firmicutes bacterium]|nr:GtrA family protein [Bacillota bacterium]